MPLTAQRLRELGRLVERDNLGYGVYAVEPPLPVIALHDGMVQGVVMLHKNQKYTVSKFDEDGKYPGCVHLNPTGVFWWGIDNFDELAEQ